MNKDLNENILNRNYSMKRNLKINKGLNENNKLNMSCANITNKYSNNLNNNLNDEISTKKKNSIKIKKIPLNKLKHKIQVNNLTIIILLLKIIKEQPKYQKVIILYFII